MGEVMSHLREVALLLLLAGCHAAPAATPAPLPPPARWWLAERDGLVVIEPEAPELAEFEVRYLGPEQPAIGQIVAVEIRVKNSCPGQRRAFRVRPSRPGLRLIDPEIIETQADRPARCRFTSDSAGPGFLIIEPIS